MTAAPAPHTPGDRPLVLTPQDLAAIEAVPLSERDLPATTYDLVAGTAAAYPDRPALHLLGEGVPWREAPTWTYRALLERIHQGRQAHLALGLPEGGVVGLMLPSLGATYAALLGAQAVGIASPVNPMLAEDHLVGILNLTGARLLLAPGPGLSPGLWEKAQRVAARLPGPVTVATVGSPPAGRGDGLSIPTADFAAVAAQQPADRLVTATRRGPGDLAAYFHTGGTTGVPKVAPHTHASEVYMAWALGCPGLYPDDAVVLSGLPLFHVNAVHVTGLAPFMHAATVVSLGPLGYRDKQLLAEFWQIIAHYRVPSFSGVPPVYASLPPIPDGADISSLRAGAVGAAPLPPRVRERFEATAKVPLLEGYGLTEATCASAVTPVLATRAGSVGLRLPYQHIKAVTVDAGGLPAGDCAPGVTGVLAISGPAVFPGYLRPSPEGPCPDPAGKVSGGWLVTGDLGSVDADGYVYLTGRASDLIIRGGHNIDPRPVEDALLRHPEVAEAAVVGEPDPHAGEVPIAYLVLRPGATASVTELQTWAAVHAPEPAAAPRSVRLLDALPTTAIGKIYKPGLVLDAVTRVVQGLLDQHGLAGRAEAQLRDAKPHVTINLTRPASSAALAADLGRYLFTYDIIGEPSS